MLSKSLKQIKKQIFVGYRSFGAMGEVDRELLFEHKFTNDMKFTTHFDKMKCFRVMDGEGNIINKGYDIDK